MNIIDLLKSLVDLPQRPTSEQTYLVLNTHTHTFPNSLVNEKLAQMAVVKM